MKLEFNKRWAIFSPLFWFVFVIGMFVCFAFVDRGESGTAQQENEDESVAYLPAIQNHPTPTPTFTPTATATPTATPTNTPTPTPLPGLEPEVRGMWVSRFDWTSSFSGAQPEKIDEIVDNAALAGINLIYFQVRGTADAFYTPGLEPWSQRLTGNELGDNPGWDPLARLIEKAHAQNIQVHAYLNIYPVWFGCDTPKANTNPQHLYHKLDDVHIGGVKDVLQQSQFGTVYGADCENIEYRRVSPASGYFDEHVLAVTQDLINRYDIDGIHLDHIRYGATGASYDPVSEQAYALESSQFERADWQRRQVNGTVNKFYDLVVAAKKDIWLSAAVWPLYVDYWGWGAGQGYHNYYQDSKEWAQQGYIDSISPMIYPGTFNCPDDSFWSLGRWETLVRDFQATKGERYVVPGIGTGYCSFSEIENRINLAREIGTAGHALFSYKSLLQEENGKTYFELLREGPYQNNVAVPEFTWHP
ncbi:MAG: family 10 glycosylhydrolase [Chloroflexota bacterium]